MYLSLQDRPAAERAGSRPGRPRVARVVVLLGLVSLLTDVSSESVSAILPLYLTGALGLSMVAYGFVEGLYQGVSAVVRIGSGLAADRSEHPKWVAFAGYGLSCAARVLMIGAAGLASMTAVVTADRVGKGIRTAPRDAMIAAATPTEDLGRAFGVHRTLDTVGAVIGPLLAFAVLWAIPDGYRTVMVVSLAFALVGLALLALLVPGRPSRPAGEQVRPRVRWRDVADPRLRRMLLLVGVLALLTVGDGFVYLALLERSDFAAYWFPLLYVGTNAAYLVLALPLGRVADRIGRARMLVLGHLALLAVYVVAALPVGGAAVTVACLVALGAFYAATDGVTAAVAGRLVPPGVRTSGIAAAQTVVAVGRLAAATGFGALWFAVGPQAALVVVAVALAVVLAVVVPRAGRLDRVAEPA
ncbi:MFS transporter [Marmoricola sp. Leaf446]|uniref:MFS transporter n=1 Tax=Marmoricola sp. Leaf446 TaxID=1736379 RepID=UPI00070170F2|nr:MFS transporter [Marmoricola sp. Leaf446]KQT90935.1 MFS transporter [Marmoricola sp. Leaf446]